MNYYYLVASLPALALGSAPPLSPAQFRTIASEHLLPSDLAELDAVFAGGGTSAFGRAWRSLDHQVRNTLARARATKRGLDAERHVVAEPGLDLTLARGVQDALAAANPRARERALDELRVAALDHWAFLAPFALDAVLAYALKLDVCARWAARTEAAGRARLHAQIDAMLAHYDQRAGDRGEESA